MEEYFKVTTLENDNEASLMDSILKERAIPYSMKSYYDTAFDGLYQTQKGWGHISAPKAYHEQIMEIIIDLRKDAARSG